nr:uncharacterized protein CTRU02_07131 [Colletotrichum truncatum]KAF6791947.1 hypothetical protein CTRU02_07131 [Colletotrichum truncatum]
MFPRVVLVAVPREVEAFRRPHQRRPRPLLAEAVVDQGRATQSRPPSLRPQTLQPRRAEPQAAAVALASQTRRPAQLPRRRPRRKRDPRAERATSRRTPPRLPRTCPTEKRRILKMPMRTRPLTRRALARSERTNEALYFYTGLGIWFRGLQRTRTALGVIASKFAQRTWCRCLFFPPAPADRQSGT